MQSVTSPYIKSVYPSFVFSSAELFFLNIDYSTLDKSGQPPLCNYSHQSFMQLITNSVCVCVWLGEGGWLSPG